MAERSTETLSGPQPCLPCCTLHACTHYACLVSCLYHGWTLQVAAGKAGNETYRARRVDTLTHSL